VIDKLGTELRSGGELPDLLRVLLVDSLLSEESRSGKEAAQSQKYGFH